VKNRSSALLEATIVPNGVERSFLWVPLNRPVTKRLEGMDHFHVPIRNGVLQVPGDRLVLLVVERA